jgi:hypothetical protein
MTDTPQLLLGHHLKVLKLPTFLREYDKLARQCATEGVEHTGYLHIPTKPAGYPEVMSATHSNLIAATVPISSRPGDAVSSGRFW